MRKTALQYLQQNIPLHISFIEPLRLGRAEVLAAGPDGVFLRHKTGQFLLSADDSKAAEKLFLPYLPEIRDIIVCGKNLSGTLCEKYGWKMDTPCYQAVYEKKTPLPVSGDIRQLGMEYFDAVLDGYSLFRSPEYVENRLKAGVIYGAFVEDKLAGFVGEHREGSMGMLEVFPEFRRMGLGAALESFQINRFLKEGRIPYDQVILGNEKSMALQKKLGMTISGDTINWLVAEG